MAIPPVRYKLDPDDPRVLEALAPLRERQREFVLLVCQGTSYIDAYRQAYNKDAGDPAMASRLANHPTVAQARKVIRQVGEEAARAAALLSAFERREFCARVVRDDDADDDTRLRAVKLDKELDSTDGDNGFITIEVTI